MVGWIIRKIPIIGSVCLLLALFSLYTYLENDSGLAEAKNKSFFTLPPGQKLVAIFPKNDSVYYVIRTRHSGEPVDSFLVVQQNATGAEITATIREQN